MNEGGCSGLECPSLDVRIVSRREHDDFCPRVTTQDFTTRLQPVAVGEVHVDHDYVRLEALGGIDQSAAV
jgi:hypothetical protein